MPAAELVTRHSARVRQHESAVAVFSFRALALLLSGGLRASGRRPGPLLFTIVGMLLATALVVGVDLANSAARQGYEQSFARLNRGVTHVVRSVNGVLSDADYVQLRAQWRAGRLPAVRAMTPFVVGSIELLPAAPRGASSAAADTAPPHVLVRELWGVDLLQSGVVKAGVSLSSGGPQLVAERVALRGDLAPGLWSVRRSKSIYAAEDSPASVPARTVLRLIDGPGGAEAAAAAGAILLADIATAQELLGLRGRLSRIELQLDCRSADAAPGQSWLDRLFPGLDVAPAEGCPAEASVQLPQGLRLASLAAQRNEDLSAAAAFNFNLGALSLLAAAVAAFLVHQVVVLGVNRQTLELGRLRALGMSGQEVAVRLVLGYVGVAAVAGALGVVLGSLLAQLLVERVSAVVNDLFYRVAVSAVQLDAVSATKGMAVAMGVAVLASIGPAVRIARTPPVQLMRGERASRARALSPWFGVGCLAATALLLIFTTATAGALLAIGFALLATVGLAGRLLPRVKPAPQMAVVPRLALADLERTGRDAGLALGALVIAVATAFGMAWMIASFRDALTTVLDERLSADVIVRVDAADSDRLLTLIKLPGVTDVALAAHDELRLPIAAFDSGAQTLITTALRVVDAPASETRRIGLPSAALAAQQVALSEPLAHRLGVSTGDVVQVGRCRLRVGGVFKEYGSVQGRLTAARAVLAPCLPVPRATEAEIRGNVSAAQVQAALAGTRDLMVAVPAQVRSVALAIFDRTFAVTEVVRWLALLVAAIALFASLSIWMTQRAAELGVLRALGLSGVELGQVLALQTLLLGAMAILLALPLGALIAWILTAELHPRAFGWSFPLHLSLSTIADTLVVALLAVLAGALFPVLTLARTPAVHWLQQARHG